MLIEVPYKDRITNMCVCVWMDWNLYEIKQNTRLLYIDSVIEAFINANEDLLN